jgi:unsaturated chondroitin disaccharide hydrolase
MFAKQRGAGGRRKSPASLAITLLFSFSLLLGWVPGHALAQDPFETIVQHDFAFAASQLNTTLAAVASNRYPSTTRPDGSWNTTDASDWTSGFFPGSLWLMYQRTGAGSWQAAAAQRQAAIEGQKTDSSTHDVGFKIFTSFGNGYRLTADEAYRQVALTAAASLAKRYSSTVGCIRSWGSISDMTNFKVIIDNMMNIELLFWASKNGGKSEWYDMAVSHALKTRLNHVRADGSTYHLVTYNPTNGAVKSKDTVQGYNAESTWSRGQAWAIYGFTVAYRETGDPRFLETARQTADYFITHLPADKIPYWDFELPNTAGQPRDSSAAAIAASGLLELGRIETDTARKQSYVDSAKAILTSLSSPAYLAEGTGYKSILLHGTRNNNSGSTDGHDTGLIYGDYYFLEALLRAPSQPVPTGTVTGRVTDRSSGRPITGATIASSRGATTTNTNGEYTIVGIAAGSQTIAASATGYARAEQTVAVPVNGSVTVDFALSLVPGAPIKAITFESNSLTGPNGADSVAGSGASLETSAPLKDRASARVQGTAYLQQGFTGVDDFYVSLYLKLSATPASSARVIRIVNAGTTVGNLLLTSNRTLQLRNGSSTIGSSSPALTLETVYRIGLHQKKSSANNAVLEAFFAQGDADFIAPFAALTSGTWTTQASQIQFGATNGNAISAVFDDVGLDAAVMPGPGGGTPPTPDTQPPTAPTSLAAIALSASQIRLTWSAATDNIGVAGYRVYRDGGAAPIALVTTGTSHVDGGLLPATTYSYRVAAFDAAGNQSPLSAPASATTLATPPPPTGQPIKTITFEGSSLGDPANGVDSVSGSVARETASPIKGLVSARIPNDASSYLTENFAGVDKLFVSFYFRMNARPATDVRIAFISNAGTTLANVVLRPTGALRLRVGTTTIGADTAPLAVGTVYRVGLHEKKGSAANALLEGFLAVGDTAFGAPFAALATGSWTTQADRLRFGATNGNALDATFDDIKLDAAAMPAVAPFHQSAGTRTGSSLTMRNTDRIRTLLPSIAQTGQYRSRDSSIARSTATGSTSVP